MRISVGGSYRDRPGRRAGDTMPCMSQARRTAAILVLFLIGFGVVALADALDAWWPLFLTPLPYAAIAWLVIRGDDEALSTPVSLSAAARKQR
jgi:hypothetical protein